MQVEKFNELNLHRIEMQAETPESIEEGLQASVHDPLWFLARQWQFGEFNGEDAASPKFVEIKSRWSIIDDIRFGSKEKSPDISYDRNKLPMEVLVTSEPFDIDLATAVELGQQFEFLVKQDGLISYQSLFDHLQDKFNLQSDNWEKQDEKIFLSLCKNNLNGIKLYKDAKREINSIDLSIFSESEQERIKEIFLIYIGWIDEVFGGIPNDTVTNNLDSDFDQFSLNDSLSWKPERLEYALCASAPAQNKSEENIRIGFNIHPERDGTLDWYTFDCLTDEKVNLPFAEESVRSLLPIHVQFSGMPNKRWWQFEDHKVNLSQIKPELKELAKGIVLDFMLIYNHDWFVVPFDQALGSIYQIEYLKVVDVFGGETLIERSEQIDSQIIKNYETLPAAKKWSMFTTSSENSSKFANYLIFPPTTSEIMLESSPIEEVHFIRDEMANLVWAIEKSISNNLGITNPTDDEQAADKQEYKTDQIKKDIPLKYNIQSEIPHYWIPFLAVGSSNATYPSLSQVSEIALERGAMLDSNQNLIHPKSKILKPTNLTDRIHNLEDSSKRVYRIREEEVPRVGVRVSRNFRLSRWIDGSTHLWVTRQKQAGRGEGRSNLRFDRAIPYEIKKDTIPNLPPEEDTVPNLPPEAGDNSYRIGVDMLLKGNVLANDIDPDGHPLTARLVTEPEIGAVSLSENGYFQYQQPGTGYTGRVDFTYEVCDSKGMCDTAVVEITIFVPAMIVIKEIDKPIPYAGDSYIRLELKNAPVDTWAGVQFLNHENRRWETVKAADGKDAWHGTADRMGERPWRQTWWLAKNESLLGSGPYRWVIYSGVGGYPRVFSERFYLPKEINQGLVLSDIAN